MTSRERGAAFCALKLWKCVLALLLSFSLFVCSAGVYGQEGRKLVKKVDPVYPDLARRMNMTGTVKVEISIGPDGSVNQVKTLGGNPVLATAVEDAVKQWKYAAGASETKKLEFKF